MSSPKKIHISRLSNAVQTACISIYPSQGERSTQGKSGISAYIKNIHIHLKQPLLVLSDRASTQRNSTNSQRYTENNTLVHPCFTPNSPRMWVQLMRTIRQYKNLKNIVIQFDVALYGNARTSGFILPFTAALRLLGYSVSVVNHSVIQDTRKLSGHLGLNNTLLNKLKMGVLNRLFNLFYRVLGCVSTEIIVLEPSLNTKLQKYVPARKISVIPLPIENKTVKITKKSARKALGIHQHDHVVLFFGFINWFKGADMFIDTFQNTTHLGGRKTHFYLAGGKSATLSDYDYYKEYYAQLRLKVKRSKAVTLTDFVPEDKISTYFKAADLVVFPYRSYISTSGVLSLAIAHNKQFIISKGFSDILDNADFKKAFKESCLEKSDIVFESNSIDLFNKAEYILSENKKRQFNRFTQHIAEARSIDKITHLYNNLYNPHLVQNPHIALSLQNS